MTVNFESMYSALTDELSDNQKKISVRSALNVYYGLSKEGYYRIAFLSVAAAPQIESTKMLRVTQGEEAANAYWTCFDLLQPDAKKVFFTFCENLIEAITDVCDEQKALRALKKRYITWKTMFKRDSEGKISREVLQGLFGELYFLKNFMLKHFSPTVAVQAWSGPEAKSKDFAVDNSWYEVKTVGANSTTVKISSLTQLTSSYPGHLAVIKVEAMSDMFENGEACVGDLFKYILEQIDDEHVEELFLSKISAYGVDLFDESLMSKFDVKKMSLYQVDEKFPRLTEDNVSYVEICDVTYSLIINSLKPFLEGELNGTS